MGLGCEAHDPGETLLLTEGFGVADGAGVRLRRRLQDMLVVPIASYQFFTQLVGVPASHVMMTPKQISG